MTLIDANLFENVEASARANIANAISTALKHEPPGTKWSDAHAVLTDALSEKKSTVVLTRLARACFMIEPVNSAITSTKFACRWSTNEDSFFSFGPADPRWAGFKDCDDAAEKLLAELIAAVADDGHLAVLQMSIEHGITSHELPIDYATSEPNIGRIHGPHNLVWAWDGPAESTVKLRSWLLEQRDHEVLDGAATVATVMAAAINQKVQVKTYLTDRAQTGPYKTNREKRWESHPASVQFASRSVASAIERELLEQICFFDGFPEPCRNEALEMGLLEPRDTTRCPVTLDKLEFRDFAKEVLSPTHGRSRFQVGHLNPLKTLARTNDAAGHTAQNIAWISAAGNRIQGDLSLADVRSLVKHIAQNYRLLLPDV